MPGHLFILRGLFKRLACDIRAVPCDVRANPLSRHMLTDELLTLPAEIPGAWQEQTQRVLRCTGGNGAPQPWLLNVGGTQSSPIDWYIEGVRQFLEEVGAFFRDNAYTPLNDRAKPLVGLNIVGIGRGGAKKRAGDMVSHMLPVLHAALDAHDFDIALVAYEGPAFAAAQSARMASGREPWPELSPELLEQAETLSAGASAGRLALFMGAGVSRGAGLPDWSGMLTELANSVGLADEAPELEKFDATDRATVVQRRMPGGGEEMRRIIAARMSAPRHSLQHGLLACLPIREAITTNYDELFETAWTAAGRKPSALPHGPETDADCWILKMHGTVSQPKNIVLTREDYVRYLELWSALAGIVQTLLITRHMLFVGYSLSDHDFHQMAEAVRRVVRANAGEPGAVPAFGAMLDVSPVAKRAIVAALWEQDLSCIYIGAGEKIGDDSRLLEIFLDCVLGKTRTAAHLLDETYTAVLSSEEKLLKDALTRFLEELPAGAKAAPAWSILRQALVALGYRD